MKKAAIAGVIVVLGAVWTGTAWYTGKKAEEFVRQAIADGNVQLQKASEGWGVQPVIELLSFERGVFSSTERYQVTFSLPAGDGKPAREEALQFVEHLDHGPFPLSSLKSGNLAPVLVASRFQLEETPFVKAWFAASKGDAPVAGNYTVSYGRQVEGDFAIAPASYSKDQNSVAFSGLKGQVSHTMATKHTVLKLQSDSLSMASPSPEDGGVVTMDMKGLTLDSDVTPGAQDLFLGKQKLTLQDWTLSSAGQPPMRFKDTVIGVDMAESDKGLAGDVSVDFGMIRVQDKDVAGMRLALASRNLDPKALKSLNSTYEQASRRALAQGADLHEAPDFTPEESAAMKAALAQLLAGNPTLSLSPLELRTANGTSTFAVDTQLGAAPNLDDPLPDVLMQVIHKLDAKLVLSKANMADLLSTQAQLQGVPAERALSTAKGQAEMLGTMAGAMGVAKLENDNIVSTLSYADGQVDFNGKKMPVEQFLMMALSGAAAGGR
ncbi:MULTISPECIES: YdgA family protein [unclassified Achromobacter]|uniref:YdgA family protein n=1 Tax=unclassified Achromobacter TaxID=2626865 RepID=UPI00069E5973|nr:MULTISPECIES: YdgA family protein [unclassified Achromobacter]KOF54284.1 hypothetical protein AD428_08005 [Achromobacter sp. DMS1]